MATTTTTTTTTAASIKYSSKSGEYAREYAATVGDLRINIDKVDPGNYYTWGVFIVRFSGPSYVESSTVTSVYSTYACTLAEAKAKAHAFVDADQILKFAV